MRNQLASHVYDITYGSVRPTRQPGVRRRLDRARHDAAALDPAHPRAAQPEEDRHRLDGAADPLSRLLRDRHVGDWASSSPSRRRSTLLKESGRAELLEEVYRPVPRGGAQTRPAFTPGEPCAPDLRAVHAGGDFGARSSSWCGPRGIEWQRRDRDHLPDDREPARGRAQPHRRLVFHGQVSDARRLPGGEPGLRELLREARGRSY